MKIVRIVICLFLIHQTTLGDGFSTKLVQSYQNIIKLKLDSATYYLNDSEQNDPDNVVNLLIANYIDAIEILLTEDKRLFDKWETNFDNRIEKIKKLKSNSPYYQYVAGEIYLQAALLHFKFENNITGILYFKKGYKYLTDNRENYPEFKYQNKSLGIIMIMFSLIPNEIKWVIELLGHETELAKGLELLKTCEENSIIIHHEAFLIHQWINLSFLSKNKIDLTAFKNYIQQRQDENLSKLIWILALKKNNQSEQAMIGIEELIANKEIFKSPYYHFIYGQMLLYKGDYILSQKQTEAFLSEYHGISLRKAAYYQLYLLDYLLNQSNNLKRYKDSVLLIKSTNAEQDKIAEKRMIENPLPTIGLLKARLYFDGGYFDEANSVLEATSIVKIKNPIEQVEYYYRKARIAEKISTKELMVKYYQMTISTQKDANYHFAPNSYLQLAKYESTRNTKKALEYLNSLKNYSNYSYQKEIETEAKALKIKISKP